MIPLSQTIIEFFNLQNPLVTEHFSPNNLELLSQNFISRFLNLHLKPVR